MGSTEQTKAGNLIIGGVLRLGQFATAPSGTEGALYFDTTDNTTKLYSSSAWNDLGGGWDGIIPNYTTVQRNALSLVDGLIVYNTTENAVQICVSGLWRNVGAKLSTGILCTLDGDCDSTHCVDGVCCSTACTGNCNRCNVASSIGTCTDVASDCTGNCDICSSGNCIANATLCTGNCDVCSGSGTAYSCAASNALCSNTTASCACSGSGTVFNCSTCVNDPNGLCGEPSCSSYTCGNTVYGNLTSCGSGNYCYSGVCTGAYCDADNDGYYTTSKVACPSGRVRLAVGNDCNDTCATCYPGSTATTASPDGKDQDCDGTIDETACTEHRICTVATTSCNTACAQGPDCGCSSVLLQNIMYYNNTNCTGDTLGTRICSDVNDDRYAGSCLCSPAKYH